MSYEIVEVQSGQTTLQVKVTMYRDALSGGAQFDDASTALFGVYRKNDQGGYDVESTIAGIGPENFETFLNGPLEIEKAEYNFLLVLDQGSDYFIVYQRCCRQPALSNIIRPADTGIAIVMSLTSEALVQCIGTGSPAIINPVFSFAEAGVPFSYDQPFDLSLIHI